MIPSFEDFTKHLTSESQLNKIRKNFLERNWINYQECFFTFENANDRKEFLSTYHDYFHGILDKTGYCGCGIGIVDMNDMKIIMHEQTHTTDEILEFISDNPFHHFCECSCWQIRLISYQEAQCELIGT